MTKNQNIIYWSIGIILFLIVATQFPLPGFPFALVTTTICADGVTNYYPLDGTFVDMKGGPDITNNGASFIAGKLGSGALEFNNTDSISFPTLPLNLSVGFWINNYSNELENWTYVTYTNTSILSDSFMLGFSGAIDEISVGENIPGFPNIQPCYLTTYEENITCKNYATEQVTPQTIGCLEYSGTVFPNCTYEWLTTSGFYVQNNICNKRFYCSDILTTDFSTLALCQAELNVTVITNVTEEEEAAITAPPPSPPPLTIRETLEENLFKIGDFGIKLWHILALIVVVLILYFTGAFGKK